MFDFLKKKIGGFVDKLTKKEEEKEPVEEKPPEKKPEEKPKEVPKPKEIPKVKKEEPKAEEPPKEEKPPAVKEKPKPVPEKKAPEIKTKEIPKEKPVEIPKPVPKKEPEKPKAEEKEPEEKIEPPKVKPPQKKEPEIIIPEKPKVEKKKVEAAPEIKAPPEEIEKPPEAKPKEVPKEEIVGKPPEPEEAPKIEKKKEEPKERIKIGAVGAIKSFITRKVEISESDVKGMIEDFELELLESDVDMGVAESIKEELKERLIGAKVQKDNIHDFINQSMIDTLTDMMINEDAFDILDIVEKSEKPVRIMFLGINGAGKTTTIAKVARLLMDNKYKVVFAAADTFRAAAIEQIQVHADRLGVKAIKREYGSDPTSVAYDASNYAKAHDIEVVLIDTAGRQDTNISLINEMKKMTRVIKPDLKIYIGESIAGQAIIEQVSAFNKEIGIDGVILTKLDCDAKGGTMISINKATGVPIVYVGVGQEYRDLEKFNAESIAKRIVT